MFEFINFSVGSSGCVDNAAGSGTQGLDLKFFRLKNDGGFSVGGNAVDAGGRAGGDVEVAGIIGGDRPDVGGGSGVEAFESGREFETTDAADGDCGGRAFREFVEARLLPGACAFGEGGGGEAGDGQG